jgi:putative DNA-invertase from lambdoid prophage Rac
VIGNAFAGEIRSISRRVQLGQVALYCRVSTDDQSCERQERDLRAFAKRAGHKIVAVFKESASGAKNDRIQRKKAMALASSGKLMRTIMAGLAEFERHLIRERVKSGLAAARSRGVQLGRREG